jgi:fatty acid desaturase
MIAQTIQLALAPVFVLVAIGNILNLLSSRLGRVVDRSRHLQERHMSTDGPDHDEVVAEIRMIDRRITLITRAIRLMVISGLFIGTTVAVLFLEELVAFNLQRVAAATFLCAIALLMWALVLFLSETQIAAQQLRIPRMYLEV